MIMMIITLIMTIVIIMMVLVILMMNMMVIFMMIRNGDSWHPTVVPWGEMVCVDCTCKVITDQSFDEVENNAYDEDASFR